MSHRLYQTEGLILARRDWGEAGAIFQILTPDLGLVRASATGVRYLKSKLRAQLGVLGLARFSFVRGREFWKITNVEASPLLRPLFVVPAKLAVWARVAALILRLVHGESAEPEIFGDLRAGLEALALAQVNPDSLLNLETVIVLRLLHGLGYVKNDVPLESWSALSVSGREQLISLINHGLEQSQL